MTIFKNISSKLQRKKVQINTYIVVNIVIITDSEAQEVLLSLSYRSARTRT